MQENVLLNGQRRCRLLDPDPLRKMDRQTRVSRRFSRCASKEFAILDPYVFLALQRSGTVDQKVPLIADRRAQPDQRARRRPLDFGPIPREFAAVAGAGNDTEIGVPRPSDSRGACRSRTSRRCLPDRARCKLPPPRPASPYQADTDPVCRRPRWATARRAHWGKETHSQRRPLR